MTYEEVAEIMSAARGMSYEAMIRAKADGRLMVRLGQDRGFASLEALGLTAEDVYEQAPHCLATVAGWQTRTKASLD